MVEQNPSAIWLIFSFDNPDLLSPGLQEFFNLQRELKLPETSVQGVADVRLNRSYRTYLSKLMAVLWRSKKPGAHIVFLFCTIIISCFSVFMSSAAVVTLDSIEIFRTHEWLKSEPTVYFKCKGENQTILPDVKKKNLLYSFKGEESWQPLTNIIDKKCKRCGFYEHDAVLSDDVFEEWEFCASDFTRSDGKYVRYKDKEFNATFLCLECVPLGKASTHTSNSQDERKPLHWMLIALICGLVVLVISGAALAYKYWQKRKKQQEQARFLRLFEDNDDIEDELGIGPLSHVI